MTTIRFRDALPVLAFVCFGVSAAPDLSIPADGTNSTPAPAGAVEEPAVLDPVAVSAEKRAELSFRTIQIALERTRSNSVKDEDQIVCLKQMPTGSHRPVINCATNGFWRKIRENSLAGFTGGGGGGSAKKGEKVFTISMDDYAKLEARFGKLPEDLKEKK